MLMYLRCITLKERRPYTRHSAIRTKGEAGKEDHSFSSTMTSKAADITGYRGTHQKQNTYYENIVRKHNLGNNNFGFKSEMSIINMNRNDDIVLQNTPYIFKSWITAEYLNEIRLGT